MADCTGSARRVAAGRALGGSAVCSRRVGRPLAAPVRLDARSGRLAGLRLAAVAAGPLPGLAAERSHAAVDAVLTGDPEVRHAAGRRTVVATARAERLRVGGRWIDVRSPVLLIVSSPGAVRDWTALLPSQRIRVEGGLAPPRYDRDISAVVFCRGPPELVGTPSLVQRVAGDLRAGLRASVGPLGPEERGVLPALVVGDTSLLDPGLEEEFRTTGLAHLLVVSGTNVTLVLGAVLVLARWIGLGARVAPLLGGVAVLAFAVLARPDPSVLRASVMGLVTVVALATGRERQGRPALCAAVLGLVLFEPMLARSYGFTLSVLATAGLLVLAPVWRDRLQRRMPAWLAEAIAIPAAAQVACAPVLAMLSGEVSLVAVAANLMAAPAVAPSTVLGLLAAVAALVSLPLGQALAQVGGLAVSWLVTVAHTGASLRFATVPWPAGVAGAGLLLVAILLGALLLRYAAGRRIVAGCLAGVVAAGVVLHILAPGWPPPGWLLVACDVGQGDALALATGRNAAVVVDAGPEPRLIDRCLRDLRVRKVPLLVLTHGHEDHVDGLPGVLRGRSVGAALVGGLAEPDDVAGSLERPLGSVGVPVRRAEAGQRWRVGRLDITVLGPPAQHPGNPATEGTSEDPGEGFGENEGSAENNASVVLHVRWPDATALLTGDIETEAQRHLAAAADVRADILKVPHHGSASQDPGFLRAVGARVVVTSVGADNSYGHPSAGVLRQLRAGGARSLRTDRDGDVAVAQGTRGLVVVGRRGSGGSSR
ncbi:MAG: MBL fold metallo-hydrolase [Streptosporangiales bacterium]|nr:MBL fold metallo-hydrolase [Streptosporangiales bacterium]